MWFFSLDVPRLAIVGIARSVFALPYCWSAADHVVDQATEGVTHRYTMRRRWPGARPGNRPSADTRLTVGDLIPPDEVSELDHFLSARWALLTRRRRRLLHGRVHHQRWTSE